jgi:hypothetical protein
MRTLMIRVKMNFEHSSELGKIESGADSNEQSQVLFISGFPPQASFKTRL